MFQNLALLAIAGGVGTLARYGMSEAVSHLCGRRFPWSTLSVNLLGCLLFGLFWTLAAEREWISQRSGLIVLTGFMGAFTTFSTFAFETSQFVAVSKWGPALANVAAQNVCGVLAVIAGAALARWL
jgi:fluoride exporter